MKLRSELFEKYNKPVPRYTSYPAVPHWNEAKICKEKWRMTVKNSFEKFNNSTGVSLYIHLPYCESLCTYCGCNTRITINHKVEIPYIDALIKEFDLYLEMFGEKPNIKEIHLGGGTPTFFSPENLKTLIASILDKCNVMPEAEFSFEAHPANTTHEHLRVLRVLGFTRLSLGIQDFDEKIQKVINRKQSLEDVERVVEQARSLGYKSINFDVIYGLPLQTVDSIEDTMSKVLRLMPKRIAYYSYAHVPWKHKGQRAYDENDLPTNEAKRKLYEEGRELLEKAGYLDIGMDHFALPNDTLAKAKFNKSLHRNFMGYVSSKSDFLLGLGVSSISDVFTGYAQNVKSVEGYIEKINEGRLAVFKGHFMSEVDTITKVTINEIMCNERVLVTCFSGLPVNYKLNIYQALKDLEDDGLIELGENLEVTEVGRKFVRNIASVFDYRIFSEAAPQKFSMSI